MNIIEHNKNGLVYLTADGFEAAGGVAHGFSTRLGGVSEGIYATLNLGMNRGDAPDRVRENYRRFCAAIGADMGNIVCASQVHGDTVRTVTAADLGIGLDEPEPWQADGLVTDIPGVTLAVYSADCLPILLYDPVRRVVGAVHAGWRGTALGIAAKAVERMVDCYGCDRLDILAAVGPGISKCLNAKRLESAGLDPDHIAVSADCTCCLPEKYWSHRYTHGERGSQAAMIAIV